VQNFDTLVRAAQRPGINAAAMAAGTLANGIAMSYEPLFDGTQRHSGIRTRSTIAGGIRRDEAGLVGEHHRLHPGKACSWQTKMASAWLSVKSTYCTRDQPNLITKPWTRLRPPISTSITGMLKVLDSARPDASVSRRPGPASSGARVRRGETLATVYDR